MWSGLEKIAYMGWQQAVVIGSEAYIKQDCVSYSALTVTRSNQKLIAVFGNFKLT